MKQKEQQAGEEKKPVHFHDRFVEFARWSAEIVGTPWMFLFALLIVVIWAFAGPFFHFSDTWQLVINTGTTIVTFLIVFLIQSTQNRDSRALHLKLDELIRAIRGARNRMLDLEDMPEEDLKRISTEFERLQKMAINKGKTRKSGPDEQE